MIENIDQDEHYFISCVDQFNRSKFLKAQQGNPNSPERRQIPPAIPEKDVTKILMLYCWSHSHSDAIGKAAAVGTRELESVVATLAALVFSRKRPGAEVVS